MELAQSGWIYSLIQVLVLGNFGSLWEEMQKFPLDLGESLGLAFPRSLAGGEFQGRFVGRGFRCAQDGFSHREFPAEHFPFLNFPIPQNTGRKWGWIVNRNSIEFPGFLCLDCTTATAGGMSSLLGFIPIFPPPQSNLSITFFGKSRSGFLEPPQSGIWVWV